MDGLLIDSEEIYTQVTNKLLREYGKPDLPWSIKAQLQGRPGPQAGVIFFEWAKLPISMDEWLAKQSALQRELFPGCKPLPGVLELLSNVMKAGVHIALATSSHKVNFDLKTAHLKDLFSVFPASQQVLGDDPRIGDGRGKPAPYIYLLALETINAGLREKGEEEIRLEECLVFEDAVPGVEAGRRAGMRVVWVPHPGLANEFKVRKDEVLAGLCGEAQDLGSVNELQGKNGMSGWPGQKHDGWGKQLKTLENFPYEQYGIKLSNS